MQSSNVAEWRSLLGFSGIVVVGTNGEWQEPGGIVEP